MTVFAHIDTETNTLGEHRMPWEIGLLIDLPGGVAEWGYHVSDYHYEMEPEAARINHFGERFLQDEQYAPLDLHAIATGMASILDGAVFVGSNPGFDQKAMANLFLHAGVQPTWHYRSIDVVTLVSGRLGEYVLGLRSAADLMGITYDPHAQHTALGDARVTREIFLAVMNS